MKENTIKPTKFAKNECLKKREPPVLFQISFKNFNLFVNVNGEIYKGGDKGSKVGYLKGISTPFYRVDDHIVYKNSIVAIYDNSNNKIGEFYAFNNQIKLTNGNSYKFDTISPITYRQVINRIIKLDNNFGN